MMSLQGAISWAFFNSFLNSEVRHNITPRWEIIPNPLRQGCGGLRHRAFAFWPSSWLAGGRQSCEASRQGSKKAIGAGKRQEPVQQMTMKIPGKAA